MADSPIPRRDFFRQSLRGLAKAMVESYEGVRGAPRQGSGLRRIRPPGALPEGSFLSKCTGCGDCLQVCPAQCITRIPDGEPDEGTPVVVPAERACVLCTDLACTKVCEPGALLPLTSAAAVSMGLAWIDRGTCLPFQGTPCELCLQVCPTAPKAIEMDGLRPRVAAERCTGCGLCEEHCPTRPRAVQVVPAGHPAPFAPRGPAGDSGGVPPSPAPPSLHRKVEPVPDSFQPDEIFDPSVLARPKTALLFLAGPLLVLAGVAGWARLLLGVPLPIPPRPDWLGLFADLLLLLLFLVPHSLFARGVGRRLLNRPLGPPAERPLYVLLAGATLCLLSLAWTTTGPVLADYDGLLAILARGVQVFGLFLAGWSALVVGGGNLLGLPHLHALSHGLQSPTPELIALPPYRWLRQPLNLGVLLFMAATPEWTLDRLLMVVVLGTWILLVAPYEERDAEVTFGAAYRLYRECTPRWIPRFHRRRIS